MKKKNQKTPNPAEHTAIVAACGSVPFCVWCEEINYGERSRENFRSHWHEAKNTPGEF